jgi:hypothetical protein
VPAPDFQSGGAGFQTRENALFPNDRAFSPGENGPELSNQPPRLFLARALMLCIRARLYRLRKNSCFVSGHDFTGCGKAHVLYQGTTLQAAEKLMFCIRARLYRLRKNSCFVSGHDFTGCGKTHVLYQGTTLQAAEKLMFCIRARPYRLRKNSCFVSGHDFSRAVKAEL